MSTGKAIAVRALALAAAALLAAGGLGTALAASGTKAQVELWKASCRVCHQPKGSAKPLSPSSLIGMQWQRFFAKQFARTHARLTHPEKKRALGEILTPEIRKQLEKFLVDHAADSEQPMTCGR
ncbi:MAG: hypothetical protein D6718_04560 [Acidobacteria bacterium]|nr:MAG: hypothetical protein D6718_04560 [Acidobacteriota bacterium]